MDHGSMDVDLLLFSADWMVWQIHLRNAEMTEKI